MNHDCPSVNKHLAFKRTCKATEARLDSYLTDHELVLYSKFIVS